MFGLFVTDMAHSLEQLIYTSIAAPTLDAGDVFKIVEKSSQNNVARGVTGVLAFVNRHFFQAVEGMAEDLDELLGVLAKDPRHHSMKIMQRKPIAERQFARWWMQRLAVRDTEAAQALFERLMAENADAEVILSQFEGSIRNSVSGGA